MSDAKVHFRQCQAYMLSVSSSIVQLIQQYDLDLEQLAEEGEEQGDTFAVIPRMMQKGGLCPLASLSRPQDEPGHEPGAG